MVNQDAMLSLLRTDRPYTAADCTRALYPSQCDVLPELPIIHGYLQALAQHGHVRRALRQVPDGHGTWPIYEFTLTPEGEAARRTAGISPLPDLEHRSRELPSLR